MDNGISIFPLLIFFLGIFVVTSFEALLDIYLGLYEKGRSLRYFHALFPGLPWIICSLLAYLFIPIVKNSVLGGILFLIAVSIFGFAVSQIIYLRIYDPKAFNIIPLFFCVVFCGIVGLSFILNGTFSDINNNINLIERIENVGERNTLLALLEKDVDKFYPWLITGAGSFIGIIGVCMGILFNPGAVEKYTHKRAWFYTFILLIGSIYAMTMAFFWLINPVFNASKRIRYLYQNSAKASMENNRWVSSVT